MPSADEIDELVHLRVLDASFIDGPIFSNNKPSVMLNNPNEHTILNLYGFLDGSLNFRCLGGHSNRLCDNAGNFEFNNPDPDIPSRKFFLIGVPYFCVRN